MKEKNKEKEQTFDDILLNKEYQAEFDRRVQKAIKTAKNKWLEKKKLKEDTVILKILHL